MVCDRCEAKLSKIATPDPWKADSGKRKINENKFLSTARDRHNPIAKSLAPCR